jgi:hypothetical protein
MRLIGGKSIYLLWHVLPMPPFKHGKGWFCRRLPFLIKLRSMIVNICEPCEQFKKRIKEWNYWSGAVDPLPYIDSVVKPHKHLMFEGRRPDGTGTHVLVLHCLKCNQWWKLSAWPVFGCLEVLPWLPKDHPSL